MRESDIRDHKMKNKPFKLNLSQLKSTSLDLFMPEQQPSTEGDNPENSRENEDKGSRSQQARSHHSDVRSHQSHQSARPGGYPREGSFKGTPIHEGHQSDHPVDSYSIRSHGSHGSRREYDSERHHRDGEGYPEGYAHAPPPRDDSRGGHRDDSRGDHSGGLYTRRIHF